MKSTEEMESGITRNIDSMASSGQETQKVMENYEVQLKSLSDRLLFLEKLHQLPIADADKDGFSVEKGGCNDLANKPTLFDGKYSSLTGTPSLSLYATKDMANQNITNLANPVNENDAVTKAYVDAINGILHKNHSIFIGEASGYSSTGEFNTDPANQVPTVNGHLNALSLNGISFFIKEGNNGTVSGETYCKGSEWGRIGACIAVKRIDTGEYISTTEVAGTPVTCMCASF